MAIIGNPLNSVAFLTDSFNGNASTTSFTLSAAPAGSSSILVAISGVVQAPATYGVVGTTLNFSAAPPVGTASISVRYLGIPASGVTTTAYRTLTEFTATASQTTFTPPSYTVGFIAVYQNGVMLGSTDYTATNGTTVVLAVGALVNDLVTTESFYVSSVLNAIPATAGAVNSTYIANGVTLTSPVISTIINGAATLTLPTTTGTLALYGAPQVTVYTTGTGTYTTPTNAKYLTVRMVGGGGGGGGSGNAGTGGTGGTGGTTTFGSSLLTVTGGTGGVYGSSGTDGGTATVSSPATAVVAVSGSRSTSGSTNTSFYVGGVAGGCSPFGGQGGGGNNSAGSAAKDNTGSGGGSGGTNGTSTSSGGGSGGYVEAIITSPSATYSYAVGAAGTAGTVGTGSAYAGGAGGSGVVIVTAYFG